MKSFFRQISGAVGRPGSTFADLAGERAVGAGAGAMLVCALVYSSFVLWMYLAGHQPSFTGNPIPAAEYYLWQAGFLPVWLPMAWALSASVAHGLSRVGQSGASWGATAAPLGFALGVPLVFAYLVPEMIVFGVFGHDALVAAMRITGPVALGWMGFLAWKAVRAAHDYSGLVCAGLAAVSVLVFGAVTAVLVR
ncbi:MAG: hypothetical protein ACQEVA_10115 [Myxococcota bacterium]